MTRKREYVAIAGILLFALIVAVIAALAIAKTGNNRKNTVVINTLQNYVATPPTSATLTEEEFYTLKSEEVISYSSYSSYVAQSNTEATMATQASFSIKASGPNATLYEIADEYFQVYYGTQRVSPLFPMAISNVETPGRADHSITWSSLFPTRYISIDEVYTFDVTQVIRDDTVFNALSTEYSTRDRGCLQMSPTYGTNNESVNARMSGTEADKLASVNPNGHSNWIAGASSSPGDRFYLPDVLLRMQAAMQYQVQNILMNGYQPESDLQLIAMLAMSHQSSGVWTNKNHSASCGCWKSSDLCYQWSKVVTSPSVLTALTEYAATHDTVYIDGNTADRIFKQASSESYSSYATKSIVCTYPIKCLYSYIKLCQLYTQ